jgi:flagellar basal body-associated protein FliL
MASKDDERDEKDGEETPTPVSPGNSKKKMLFIIGGVLGLLLVIGIPTGILLMRKPEVKQEETKADEPELHVDEKMIIPEGYQEEDELEEGEEALGALFPLEGFVVNLQGGGYLRVRMQVEFASRDVSPRFLSKLVPIRDELLIYFANKKSGDLVNPENRTTIKDEVRELINDELRRADVRNVYFTQFIVQ